MPTLVSEKTAVVTGGASGNGRAICEALAEHGADIVVADIREDPRSGGRPTHERVRDHGAASRFVECDVTDVDDLEAALEAAEELGGVDVMVNNAGVIQREEFFEMTEAEYDRMMDVNVKGTYFASQLAAERMVARGSGSIVNLSSTFGLYGRSGHAVYCASKGAIRLLTYALADEVGPAGVRVNAIHPGVIETTMTTEDNPVVGTESGEQLRQSIPSRRFGQPEDVAGAALFLASDLASYVNGASIPVDGGVSNTG